MHAVILLAHGSLRGGAGDAVSAHAARLRERGVARLVEVGYLNYSEPSFLTAVASCVGRGAAHITVAPYFLVPGKFVEEDVRRAVTGVAAQFPDMVFRVASPIGYDARIAEAVVESAEASLRPGFPSSHSTDALLVMAHGSPQPSANDALLQVVADVRSRGDYPIVETGFLECNSPSISQAISQCLESGASRVLGVPYFLHAGRHVARDLPQLFREARAQYPGVELVLCEFIGRSERVTGVLETRIRESGLAYTLTPSLRPLTP